MEWPATIYNWHAVKLLLHGHLGDRKKVAIVRRWMLPKLAVQDYTAWKHYQGCHYGTVTRTPVTAALKINDSPDCNFLNRANIVLTVSCEHRVECPSNWDVQKMQKVSAFCKIPPFKFGHEQRWPFLRHVKTTKIAFFCLHDFYIQKSSLQNQKTTFTVKVKFSPCSSLEVAFLF